ncbi:hypothetical protein [Ramlibacter sp. WS9]|uniref:hypothetical protein n=1 Tax=Ramlibacter sp. WS9 TaxID=1882741 RepID=UPI00114463A9|nr:hypothetical protein [Ramlibacter sp. WS9]ROZ78919.1 hypothetical protein EEB15_04320 [Ramlibacter sp. WS9]
MGNESDRGDDKQGAARTADLPLGISIYICSMGAAAAVTVFDGVMNEKAAVLIKTGGWFSRVFAGSDQAGIWFVLALVFFCLFSALVTFAYKPREAKEAFILGAGVLAMLNALVKPPSVPGAKQATLETTGQPAARATFWLSSAHAQTQNSDRDRGELWLAVHGIQDSDAPDTRIYIYDARTGAPVINANARQSSKFELPYGKYNVEVARNGYRSVVFEAQIHQPSNLYRARLEPVKFDGISNLFGPEKHALTNDESAAVKLTAAADACTTSNPLGAQNALRSLKSVDRNKFTSDPLLSKVLCWPYK